MKTREKLAQALATKRARREIAVGRTSAALGALIGQRLHAMGMSQADLAEVLEVTPAAISRKLNQADMRLSSVTAILWALDIPLYREFERLYEDERSEPDLEKFETMPMPKELRASALRVPVEVEVVAGR